MYEGMKTFFRGKGTPRTSKEHLIEHEMRTIDRENARKIKSTDGIDCPVCGNKRWISKLKIDEEGFPTTVVYECECVRRRNIVQNASRSGLDSLLGKKLTDYKVSSDWQQAAKQKAADYIRDPEGWFVMLGQPGAGKTLLCSIVASQLLRDGKIVEYHSWPEVMRHANAEWFNDRNFLDEYKKVEVLFIDDFLKSGSDARALDVAYEIINYRYNRDLPTIISGEKTMTDLLKIDQALGSRISEKAGSYLINLGHAPERNQRMKNA